MHPTIPALAALLAIASCTMPEPRSEPASRPMDEVPAQRVLSTGEREYGFASGCRIVVEPKRAVQKSQAGACESHHLDIALLYASGD